MLSEAPIVEGLVAAVVARRRPAATLAEVATEAAKAGRDQGQAARRRVPVSADGELATEQPTARRQRRARPAQRPRPARPPAARLVETVRRFDAEVAVRNVTAAGPLVSGRSVSALSTLGAVAGHHIEVQASGRQAREALAAVAALVRRNFDDNVSRRQPATQPATSGPMAAAPGSASDPSHPRFHSTVP